MNLDTRGKSTDDMPPWNPSLAPPPTFSRLLWLLARATLGMMMSVIIHGRP